MSDELKDNDLVVINGALKEFCAHTIVSKHAYEAVYGPGLMRLQNYIDTMHTAKNRMVELEHELSELKKATKDTDDDRA